MFPYALGPASSWSLALVGLLLVLEAARRARWDAPVREHLLWAIATASIALAHRMSFTLPSGLELHYSGAAFLSILLGYPRALVSMAAVLALSGDPGTWGLRLLLAGALPIWVMWAIVTASRRWLPGNLFVFLLGCGVFGIFAAHAVQIAGSALALLALSDPVPRDLLDDFLPYALLLAAGETWLEGMLTTLLVVYVPGSVRLFDEAHYLRRRPP
jgi:uncharacterized membrane protein